MALYLLHFDKEIGTAGRGSARHYLGYARGNDVARRVRQHLTNTSDVKIVKAFHAAGATPTLVRIWDRGDRALERYLKRMGHFAKLCPICRPAALQKEAHAQWERRQLTRKSSRQRSPKQTPGNGGVSCPGSPTGNTGSFHLGPYPESTTGWNGDEWDSAVAPGGTHSGAPALTNTPGAGCAGTKQPSYSDGAS